MLLDFHSHLASGNSIVCTDTPDAEIPRVSLMRCIGLLPDKWSKDLEERLLQALSDDCSLNLGEVGLDRRFEHLMPMDRQVEALKRQLNHASSLNRCISLHCVRETGRLVDLLSEIEFRPFSVLWHGFTGSPETAAELVRRKVIISIGPSFHGNLKKLFEANPMLALETDYTGADKTEHEAMLKAHYQTTSEELCIDQDSLEKHCIEVLTTFCGKSVRDIQKQ